MALHCGDCLAVLPTLAENSFDACVTDPPYHLNFMGKAWDGGDIAFRPELWREVYRVLRPGAHLLAFGGTRTYHRMACAIEDAGFEIRDCIQWLYGSGFPKSHNIGNGWGTALKPACEPIVLARKPLSEKTVAANALRWGTGAINVDGCRVETDESTKRIGNSESGMLGSAYQREQGYRPKWNRPNERREDGGHILGRWPANVIHDGSDEVLAGFPETNSGDLAAYSRARFFYCAKASKKDRGGSKHPTVKPIKLLRYLVRLVTPPGGMVLDPFAGTGTLAEAAALEGMQATLIERETEYQDDIRRRLAI